MKRLLAGPLRRANFHLHGLARPSPRLPDPVFIIGTGRTGTHYLCSCLNRFEGLDDSFRGRESPWMFGVLSRRAVSGKGLGRDGIGYYEYMRRRVAPARLLDQTHPNIWNVEELLEAFPRARFVGVRRNVHSVVLSMQRHPDVSAWARDHDRYPVPNRFLGITKENVDQYRNELGDLQRHVLRWCSHMHRLDTLARDYPESVMVIDYDDFGERMQALLQEVGEFLGLEPPVDVPEFDRGSLTKKDGLSTQQLDDMAVALALHRPEIAPDGTVRQAPATGAGHS